MQWTTAARKISKLRSRIRVVQGGTSAGKTYAILQVLIFYCLNKPFHISVVAESIPHLRRGALKDFLKLMAENNLLKSNNFNKSTLTYTFDNGAIIEFFSADQPDKLRGARRDILFINECNNIDYEAYLQMEVRTRNFVYLDFNPTHEFWVHEEILPNENIEKDFIKINYKDNEALSAEIIKSIESKRNNEYWWKVYGEGEVGRLEGTIFKNWEEGEFDNELFFCYGMDFGFSNDPTTLVKVAIDEKKKFLYVKELCYSTGLSQENILQVLKTHCANNDMIVADSAEPRLISEIYEKGFNIFAAAKGADSVREGISFIMDYKIIVEPQSHNIKKELLNYVWNDKRAGIPIDKYNHCIDAMRYALEKLRVPSFYFG
jgi:phage terminase large subunit